MSLLLQYIVVMSCPVLVAVTVVHLLCCIYELNFVIGIYGYEKTLYIGFSIICGFKDPSGVLESIPRR